MNAQECAPFAVYMLCYPVSTLFKSLSEIHVTLFSIISIKLLYGGKLTKKKNHRQMKLFV